MNLISFRYKITFIKLSLTLLSFVFFSVSFAQSEKGKKYETVYAKEFQQIKKIAYNKELVSLSEITPEKNWNNYKGGAINTTDSLFYFDTNYLSISFPTNSDKIRNEYLAFYFAQKSSTCPTLFSLLKYYEPIIDQNLKTNKLPKELKLLPAVCSAFNPNSENGLGAEGFWHLNYPQAIKYGLTVNEFIDERKDFEKSTKAATRYIKDLYTMYNDWELTLTAYSCGVPIVNKLLQRHSAKTYKEIYPFLQTETQDLVQAFVAMNYIFNYDDYDAVKLAPIIEGDSILIERQLKFEAINHVINTNNESFKFLNPVLTKETFPNNFTALFPKGTKQKFKTFKDSIYFYQDSVLLKPETEEPKFVIPTDGEPFVYKVQSGDVLGVIAERFNVRVSQIQEWNDLDGTRIDINQKLTIYGKDKPKQESPKPKTEIQKEKQPKENVSINSKDVLSIYTVKSGDNLWIIAKKFSGISAQDIMDFNAIDEDLNVGQQLKIPKN